MKNILLKFIPKKDKWLVILALALTLSSCGTIFGGHITECQKRRPTDGTHRQIRPAALVFDILGVAPGAALIIDFATGAIYKPCK